MPLGKIEVAVCDTDHGYRERFVTYLVEHKSKEFTVHAFSSAEYFLEALEKCGFDIAVFGRGFAEAEETVRGQGIPLVLLKDTLTECAAESSPYLEGEKIMIASVFRYQPVETILHEVQAMAGGSKTEKETFMRLARLEVIGVFSPIVHEMQMPFSLVLTELLAEKRKVLYINLMRFSGFLELFGLPGSCDMGDIILRLRGRRLKTENFRKCVYENNGIYYIPPFGNPDNLYDMTGRDLLDFLSFLEAETDFETVLLDLGEGIRNLQEILGACSSIYCLVKAGFFYETRFAEFQEYLQKSGVQAVAERLQMVALPFSAKQLRGGMDVRRQLLWSEFGDYVRKIFQGGGL